MDREALIKGMWSASPEAYRNFMKQKKNAGYNLAKYFFHTHTDYGSPKDSILTAAQYVQIAKDMGARAIAISDHGSMYAVQLLYNTCKSAGVKLVIGVEFYVCDTVEETMRKRHSRLHLCGYAKNQEGYLVLCRLVTESNERVVTVNTEDGKIAYPCISKKLLEEYIGPGSRGHGNVILTSACIGGVLTGISMANDTLQMNIDELDRKIHTHEDAVQKYLYASEALRRCEADKAKLSEIASKKYGKRKTALKRHPDPVEEARIAAEERETEEAAAKIKQLAKVTKQGRTMISESQKVFDAATKQKYCELATMQTFVAHEKSELEQMKKELVPPEDLIPNFEKEALWYQELAGAGNWFIEIQNHGIDLEKKYMPYLAEIAKKHNIPLLAANDAHMAVKDDAIIRKFINSLRFNKWDGLSQGDEEVYLKDDVSLFEAISQVVGPDAAVEAMENRQLIADACDVELPKGERYPKYIES